VGIIACVEVTTTTVTTTPSSTPTPTTSGTTTIPTSATTTTTCQKQMAQVGTIYVSTVTYSVQPLQGTNNVDLTSSTTTNGVTFPQPSGTTGLRDQNNQPLYTITLTFNPAGVISFTSISIDKNSNVNSFSVEFYGLSNPNQLIRNPSGSGNSPVSYTSTVVNDQPVINNFPSDAPTDLIGVRITILSTTDNL